MSSGSELSWSTNFDVKLVIFFNENQLKTQFNTVKRINGIDFVGVYSAELRTFR